MSVVPVGEVELHCWEPSGVNRSRWPVTVGVPFPRGALKNEERIRVADGDKPLACEGRPLARWPDGSIRWALIDLQADFAGNERKVLRLSFATPTGRKPDAPCALSVNERSREIVVENGPLVAVFRPNGRMPFDALTFRGKTVIGDGSLCTLDVDGRCFSAGAGAAAVESRNALRVVIRCDGRFVADDGPASLNLTTRVCFFAGHPFMRIYHTVTNMEGRSVPVGGLQFSLPVALGGPAERYVTGQGLDASIHTAVADTVSIAARTVPVPNTAYDRTLLRRFAPEIGDAVIEGLHGTTERRADDTCLIETGDGVARTIPGAALVFPIAASGLWRGNGVRVALACRDFHQQAPKRLAVSGDTIALDLCWNADGFPLTLWRGTAKTHEMNMLVDDGPALATPEETLRYKRLVLAMAEPLMPTYGPSNLLQRTNAFGPIADYEPEKYPWTEFLFRHLYEQWAANPDRLLRGSTVLDFGDVWNSARGGQWQNNEMDFGAALLMHMLRTGDPRPFAAAESIVHHMIDVDTHHEAADPSWVGGQRFHRVLHGALTGSGLCHEWLQGPLYYYLLTGYERAKEVALMRAQHLCVMIEQGAHRVKTLERFQGWPMVALTAMHDHFPDARYERACELILDWLEEWMKEEGDLVYSYAGPIVEGAKGGSVLGRGVIGQGLAQYHRLTGSARAWNLLVETMTRARRTLFTLEGLAMKTSLQRRSYLAPGESDFILEPMAYLWERTGDPEWIRLASINFRLALLQRNPAQGTHSGVAGNICEPYLHWPVCLYYLRKAGITEDFCAC